MQQNIIYLSFFLLLSYNFHYDYSHCMFDIVRAVESRYRGYRRYREANEFKGKKCSEGTFFYQTISACRVTAVETYYVLVAQREINQVNEFAGGGNKSFFPNDDVLPKSATPHSPKNSRNREGFSNVKH